MPFFVAHIVGHQSMNKSLLRSIFLLSCVCTLTFAATLLAKEPTNTATIPAPKDGAKFLELHEAINKRIAQGNVDLIFVGDSITAGWAGGGKAVWEKYYASRNAANAGIGGDRTQHVLWRLDHGNVDGIKPKLAVLMIGTNNSKDNSAEEIGAGIEAIVKKLREKLPETKVLILAIFPRNEKPTPQREKNAKASQIASELADNKMVYYLDIGQKFLQPDGTLSRDIMPDYLHPNAKGYEIWAEAIEPTVAKLMGEKKP
jgi:lysophospholipase L1-like esterase